MAEVTRIARNIDRAFDDVTVVAVTSGWRRVMLASRWRAADVQQQAAAS